MILIKIKTEKNKIKKKIKTKDLTKYLYIAYKFILIVILYLLNISKSIYKSSDRNCFLSPDNSNKKIIHLIITRFMLESFKLNGFNKKIYTKEYLENGIRVMKKYLFPSLEYQRCKDFIWVLNVGDKANITLIKSLLNFKRGFKSIIIYNKEKEQFIMNITKNADVLIIIRIDYDDRIYYNEVNDVRKQVNILIFL